MVESPEKIETVPPPGVAIDGNRVRTVREAKKLTQLYVASVVGVTTDTISRWENNRYPSIKRDNAQKLADALDVPLTEILRQESPDTVETQPDSSPAVRVRSRWGVAAGVAGAALILGLLFFMLRQPAPNPIAVRWAPRFAAPGEIVPVQVKVARQPDSPFGFILRERLPAGARLVNAQPATTAGASEAKWLVPSAGTPATIFYTLQIPADFSMGADAPLKAEIVLHGDGSANRTNTVSGSSAIHIGAYHWADTNGDGRIDDDEILPAYNICEEMKGLGLDWKTIEAIWNGKGYRWDRRHGYTVVN